MTTVRTRLVALGLAGTLALSACSGGAAPTASGGDAVAGASGQLPATTLELRAPSYSSSSKADWERIIAEYKETQPHITVERQIEGWDDVTSKVKARIQAQDCPDILNDNAFAGAAEAGLLYPINEVLSAERSYSYSRTRHTELHQRVFAEMPEGADAEAVAARIATHLGLES